MHATGSFFDGLPGPKSPAEQKKAKHRLPIHELAHSNKERWRISGTHVVLSKSQKKKERGAAGFLLRLLE
jgi:hypothetical protein